MADLYFEDTAPARKRSRVVASGLFAALALLVALVAAAHADDAPPQAIALAQAAAGSWLALTDSGKHADGWDEAATLFRTKITQAAWIDAAKAARGPLGGLRSRVLRSATFTRTLPAAPDADYVVIEYDSQFEHKARAVETVMPMREPDGTWKVTGYFIR